jgi:acetylornithine deacetylase/succinyl-diaminopimelate desuccinylase-like protein
MNISMKLAALAGALFLSSVATSAPGWPAPGPMPPQDNQRLAHDILAQLVAIRSVHDVGTKGVAEALYERFKAAGFSDREMHLVPEGPWPNQVNLVVRLAGQGAGKGAGKPVMWICHMDVVDARRQDWSVPPFKLTEKDGFFYGRGTSDMKDEDAAAAAALIRLKKEGFVPDRDIIVAFTADEEVGLEQDGPAWLVKHDRNLVDAGWVMNPDGGSGEIVNGKRRDFSVETVQKTYMTFEWRTANKGGHSSEPRPDNAIYELASGLMRLARYQFPYKTNATTRAYFAMTAHTFRGRNEADFSALSQQPLDVAVARRVAASDVAINAILHTTCVATMLQAGVQENALPSGADATVQCRVFPGETEAQTLATLQQVAADPGIEVSLLHPVQPAPETVPDPKVMATITDVVHSMWPGVPVLPQMAAGASDSIFTRAGGIPSYGVGGGWNDLNDIRMHGRDERKEIGDFYATIEFTYRLMKKLGSAKSL